MRRACILVFLAWGVQAASPLALPPPAAGQQSVSRDAHILDSLAFEENRGQLDRRVQFVLRAPDYTAFFLKDRVTIGFRAADGRISTVAMRLCRASGRVRLAGLDTLPVRTSYFLGTNAAKWVRGVPHFARLRYRNVYRDVDLVFRWEAGKIEYDWVVAPGGDPAAIRVGFDRDAQVLREETGDLVVRKDGFIWRHRKPVAYQEDEGRPVPVKASFRILAARRWAGVHVSGYNRTRTLILDPAVRFSIVFGGHGANRTVGGFQDSGNAVAYNPALNFVYVAGTAVSLNFPRGNFRFQVQNGGSDAFVASGGINGNGTLAGLDVFFLGGSLNDAATGVAFDLQGNVYLAGYTQSTDFPLVNAARTAPGGGFVAKFASDFSALVYSTYVSSSPVPLAIAVDPGGSAYITGAADPKLFTASPQAFQASASGFQPAFALKLDPAGKLTYATFLGTGDGGGDMGYGIAVDDASSAYIAGFAGSPSFPTTPGVLQPACTGNHCAGAFVTKLNAAGSALVYSTFLGGGSGAVAHAIALDAAGDAYVAGGASTPFPGSPWQTGFPTTSGAFEQTTQALSAGFVAKLNPTGTALVYSTLLAGPQSGLFDPGSGANAIALDTAGGVYVTGWTQQADFPLVNPIQAALGSAQTCSGSQGMGGELCGDAFVSKLSPNGSALEWSTYLGGSDYDAGNGIAAAAGDVFVTGVTVSYDFPGYAGYTGCIYPPSSGCAGYPVIPGSVFLVHLSESADAAALMGPGVTSAASFATGVTPGGLATIFGAGFTAVQGVQTAACCPLPTELGGVSVAFGEGLEPVPLLALTSQQINLVVPWSTQAGADPDYVPVTVYVNGVPSLPVMAAFSQYQPALYAANAGYAAAQHGADYSPVTVANPAQPGEVIVLYADGLGPVQPGVADAEPAPSNPPPATVVNPVVAIGGVQAEVLFSGLAPGFVSLYQLNVRVPSGVPAGDQEVVVSIFEAAGLAYASPAIKLAVGQGSQAHKN